jgi:hypothetical protein
VRDLRREILWLLFFAALTVLMTWPWVKDLSRFVSDPGDPYLDAYILHWDYKQVFRDPLHLFDATIFYPYRDTLAFSENLFGISILVWPLFALGAGPILAHGVAELLGFLLCGYAAFRLARTSFGWTPGAILAGIVFAFMPYRFSQLPHLPYLFAAWLPLTLEAQILFLRRRSARRAAWLCFAFLMNGLCSVHWLILGLIPLGLAGVVMLVAWPEARYDARTFLRGGLALLVAGGLLAVFLAPYRAVARLYGMQRTAGEAAFFSAKPVDWINFPERSRFYRGHHFAPGSPEGGLAPGILPPLLAAAGLAFVRRRPDATEEVPPEEEPSDATDRGPPKWLRFADVAIALSALLLGIVLAAGHVRWTVGGIRLVKISDPARLELLLTILVLARLLARFPRFIARGQYRSLTHLIHRGRWPAEVWIAVVWVFLGFFGSLGMNFFFHRALFDLFSIFRALRVPARWAMISYVGFAMLAAFGARELLARYTSYRGERLAAATCGVLVLLQLAEFRAAPLALVRGEPKAPAVYAYLKSALMKGGLVELPSDRNLIDHTYVLRAAYHGKPLITAFSGFEPPIAAKIGEMWRQRPVPRELMALLESVPTSYVVVHEGLLDRSECEALAAWLREMVRQGRLRFMQRFDDPGSRDFVYAVSRIEPHALPAAAWHDRPAEFPEPLRSHAAAESDSSIAGYLDSPREGDVIRGPLSIAGWARARGADVDVRILLDQGRRVISPVRSSRPDVARVLPRLGDTSRAGFLATIEPEDARPAGHTVTVECRTKDGRVRRIGPVHFIWSR